MTFEIRDETALAWAIDKLASLRERHDRIKANAAAAVKQAANDLADAEYTLMPQIEAYAREHLPRGRKSIQTVYGRVQFTATPTRYTVANEDATRRWLSENAPELLVPSPPRIDKAGVIRYIEAEGEVPDGVVVEGAGETCRIVWKKGEEGEHA